MVPVPVPDSHSTTAVASVASRLGELLGAANVFTDTAGLSAFAIEGMAPAVVARPRAAEEVAAIVKFAATEKLAIVPCGARTKVAMGMPPRQYDIAVDMTRMNRVLAYDPDDLTLSVEAGLTLRELAAALTQRHQFLPLAVPFFDRATTGGTIAAGVDSPLRQFYGTARDYTLGMEFVTGDGALVKSGGRVVKNVSGYDMHKMMIGSFGTLGIITKINFRTFPLPEMTRTYLARFDDAAGACEFRHAIARSFLRPQSLEIVAAGGGPSGAHLLAPFAGERDWCVVTSVAGNALVLGRSRHELESVARQGEHPARDFSKLAPADERKVLPLLREFPGGAPRSSLPSALLKISALPNDLQTVAEAISRLAAEEQVSWTLLMRGVGIVYLSLTAADANAESGARLAAACDAISSRCNGRQWGSAAFLWRSRESGSKTNAWAPVRDDISLIHRLKNTFDPANIFAPGRFVGGV
jgi:glycolate oxidase FAD binding subunit